MEESWGGTRKQFVWSQLTCNSIRQRGKAKHICVVRKKAFDALGKREEGKSATTLAGALSSLCRGTLRGVKRLSSPQWRMWVRGGGGQWSHRKKDGREGSTVSTGFERADREHERGITFDGGSLGRKGGGISDQWEGYEKGMNRTVVHPGTVSRKSMGETEFLFMESTCKILTERDCRLGCLESTNRGMGGGKVKEGKA